MSFQKLILMSTLSLAGAAAQTTPAKLIVLDPGHFHATLLQKEMYPELDPRVSVFAPLGPELADYINRISLFNTRAENPTLWNLDVHTSATPLEDMLKSKLDGTRIAVFSGRNREKITRMLASLNAGLHVLADKPWIIDAQDMPKLEQALALAEQRGLAAYDIMTERYEVTTQVQRTLVNLPEVFGKQVPGNAQHPGVTAYSVHHIMKNVAGVPLRRPTWFFDVDDYGEGLADVGTHPVDLIQWTLFPETMLDYHRDIEMVSARHEAVKITKEEFSKVTGAADFPASVRPHVHNDVLDYYCDNYIQYKLKGVHVKLDVLWKWEAAPGTGDVYEAAFQGTRSRVELRQNAAGKFVPDVFVVPSPGHEAEIFAALDSALQKLQNQWPGIRAARSATEAHIEIPSKFRVGHEEHFAQVARHFFQYVNDPKSMPAWERGYMLAKYFVSTAGVQMARK